MTHARSRRLGVLISAFAVTAALQGCSPSIPSAARPLPATIAKALGTNDFEVLSSRPRYDSGGCSLIGSCSGRSWSVCVRFHRLDELARVVKRIEIGQGMAGGSKLADADLRATMRYGEDSGWTLIYWGSRALEDCRPTPWVSERPAVPATAAPPGDATVSAGPPAGPAEEPSRQTRECAELAAELSVLRARAISGPTEIVSEQERAEERVALPKVILEKESRMAQTCS